MRRLYALSACFIGPFKLRLLTIFLGVTVFIFCLEATGWYREYFNTLIMQTELGGIPTLFVTFEKEKITKTDILSIERAMQRNPEVAHVRGGVYYEGRIEIDSGFPQIKRALAKGYFNIDRQNVTLVLEDDTHVRCHNFDAGVGRIHIGEEKRDFLKVKSAFLPGQKANPFEYCFKKEEAGWWVVVPDKESEINRMNENLSLLLRPLVGARLFSAFTNYAREDMARWIYSGENYYQFTIFSKALLEDVYKDIYRDGRIPARISAGNDEATNVFVLPEYLIAVNKEKTNPNVLLSSETTFLALLKGQSFKYFIEIDGIRVGPCDRSIISHVEQLLRDQGINENDYEIHTWEDFASDDSREFLQGTMEVSRLFLIFISSIGFIALSIIFGDVIRKVRENERKIVIYGWDNTGLVLVVALHGVIILSATVAAVCLPQVWPTIYFGLFRLEPSSLVSEVAVTPYAWLGLSLAIVAYTLALFLGKLSKVKHEKIWSEETKDRHQG